MKVGIIGAGFTGLSAAYRLSKKCVSVTVFEKEYKPGGLGSGFKEPDWKWPLEKHYHHWFYSDWAVRNLADEIGQKVIIDRPKTSTFVDGNTYQLDSPLSLLLFDKLSFLSRVKSGILLAYLKLNPFWKSLEGVTSESFLKKYNGKEAWELLWKPLFQKKFANFYKEIPASWFWARVKKRSARLLYPEGGFGAFAEALEEKLKKNGGEIKYKSSVEKIDKKGKELIINSNGKIYSFDKVICTISSPLFAKITKNLKADYIKSLLNLQGVGAVNLLLSLDKQFLRDNSYWLNVNNRHFPFLAVVEHTNFMDKKNYGGEHIVYVGNYLPHEHDYYNKDAVDLIKVFYPFLKTINPEFDKKWINRAYLFKSYFAQPIIPLNYSQIILDFETPIKGLYLANIQQVYPWDRGTNYAVELGRKVADLVIKSQ